MTYDILNYFIMEGPIIHIETSLLICRENQWTGLSMIGNSVMKEFNHSSNV